MNSERERQITSIFHSAIERREDERAAFLKEACAGDISLRREVEALVAAHESAGSFIVSPAYERGAELLSNHAGALAGRSFGQYRLVSLLGSGGMGEVYLAEDMRLDRRVALKVLPAHLTSDQSQVGRFQQEARAASALNHPNIVTIYEINEAAGTHYIATEYIEGLTLRKRLGRGGLTMGEALDIAAQIASALNAAHSAGVVHRDIKPENVMLRPDGYMKVLDFGIAKLMERQRPVPDAEAATRALVQTGKGVVMGTAHYMSPEQARGVPVDARTDIWSLGVVLYEMVTGQVPFAGETASDCIATILKSEPAPLTTIAPLAPLRLEWILQKALRKDRDERYQTAKELLSDLRAVKQEVEASAPAERSFAPSLSPNAPGATAGSAQQAQSGTTGEPAVTSAATHTTSSAEYIATEIKRHKLGVVLALASLVVVVAGLGFVLYKYAGRPKANSQIFQDATVSRLTTSGRATEANISPDGKYVAYVEENADGNQSLWVKQTATGTTLQIVAPARVFLGGTAFSPDGNFVYYIMSDRTSEVSSLYQVASIGGPPKKVLVDLDSPVAVSPDGKRVAFVREDRDYKYDLMIANLDGTGERVLASRVSTNWFSESGPAWSPDGKTIACGAGTGAGGDNSFSLLGVNVETGAVKELSPKRWINIYRGAWLADGNTILIIAVGEDDGRAQIWQIAYPGGEANRITNDLQGKGRSSLGVTADGRTIVTAANQRVSQIWTLPSSGDVSRARQLTSGSGQDGFAGLGWTPDGRLVFSSKDGGQSDIWIMDADGGNRRQLTSDAYGDGAPTVSPDGRYVVFESYRKVLNKPHLWRMDIDGGNLKQLTSVEDEQPQISPDGRGVVYHSWAKGVEGTSMWQVSIDGGAPVRLTDYHCQKPSYSPDGNWIAFIYYDDQVTPKRWRNAIIPATGGVKPVKLFDRPNIDYQLPRWAPDGRSLSYIGAPAHPSNIWLQPVDGGEPRRLTDFESDLIYRHEWSRDGKTIALARGTETSDVVLLRAKK